MHNLLVIKLNAREMFMEKKNSSHAYSGLESLDRSRQDLHVDRGKGTTTNVELGSGDTDEVCCAVGATLSW
jgi:hypothetical protein